MILAVFTLYIGYHFYVRYVPVFGLRYVESLSRFDHACKVDLRDYNTVSDDHIPASLNIPIAYIPRNFTSIPSKEVIIIASNNIEKNLGYRCLRKKGFRIKGCYMITSKEGKGNNRDSYYQRNSMRNWGTRREKEACYK